MKKLIAKAKILGELAPTDLKVGGLISVENSKNLCRTDLVLEGWSDSLQRKTADTIIVSSLLDGEVKTLCYGSDFDKKIFIMTADGKNQLSVFDFLKSEVYELDMTAVMPSWLGLDLFKSDYDCSGIVNKIKSAVPTAQDICVYLSADGHTAHANFIYTSANTAGGWHGAGSFVPVSPSSPTGHFVGSFHLKTSQKRKSNKRVYTSTWGNGHSLSAVRTTMAILLKKNVLNGCLLVGYVL